MQAASILPNPGTLHHALDLILNGPPPPHTPARGEPSGGGMTYEDAVLQEVMTVVVLVTGMVRVVLRVSLS